MELRWLIKKWTDYSHNDGRSVKTHTEEPVLQEWVANKRVGEMAGLDYSDDGEWKDVPTVIEHTD